MVITQLGITVLRERENICTSANVAYLPVMRQTGGANTDPIYDTVATSLPVPIPTSHPSQQAAAVTRSDPLYDEVHY